MSNVDPKTHILKKQPGGKFSRKRLSARLRESIFGVMEPERSTRRTISRLWSGGLFRNWNKSRGVNATYKAERPAYWSQDSRIARGARRLATLSSSEGAAVTTNTKSFFKVASLLESTALTLVMSNLAFTSICTMSLKDTLNELKLTMPCWTLIGCVRLYKARRGTGNNTSTWILMPLSRDARVSVVKLLEKLAGGSP